MPYMQSYNAKAKSYLIKVMFLSFRHDMPLLAAHCVVSGRSGEVEASKDGGVQWWNSEVICIDRLGQYKQDPKGLLTTRCRDLVYLTSGSEVHGDPLQPLSAIIFLFWLCQRHSTLKGAVYSLCTAYEYLVCTSALSTSGHFPSYPLQFIFSWNFTT